ncbi:hypothetical protein [Streptomyces sp. AC495_CC817]|uniref:hypothetical protein n=1 Tax=Streptomyces sp. AC495_CC817 TaxID=2823900 RepID=UPI001C278509|nr:hypothetical protein [Streptomyces sp. AC495_CC817]
MSGALNTIDLIDYDEFPASLAASTAYMYGVMDFQDGPCAFDYDPWVHAEILDLPIVFRDDLPDRNMVACYSPSHEAVFVRPNLHGAVERCAIAHEIVHFEHGDIGINDLQEERADRIAARRLLRPSRLDEFADITEDPAVVALELGVTEKIMRVYMRMVRQGRIARYG